MMNIGGWSYTVLLYTWGAAIKGAEEDGDKAPWLVIICDLICGPRTSVAVSTTLLSIGHNITLYLRTLIGLHLAQDLELGYKIWINVIYINQNNIKEKQA
jgi:hypothetical protein